MNPDEAKSAVILVGEGRGFVVEGTRTRQQVTLTRGLVITAAHCLPWCPPLIGPVADWRERTYDNVLGPMNGEMTISAECLFIDPIGDLAVLGAAETLGDDEAAQEAYDILTEQDAIPLTVAQQQEEGRVWLLSLNGDWFSATLTDDRAMRIKDAAEGIEPGMSGSPIIDDAGRAIGVLTTGYMSKKPQSDFNASLFDGLPGRLLSELLSTRI